MSCPSTVSPVDADTLTLEGLCKRFADKQVLHDARLELRRGEVHALLGENGAGKSTLMNLLTGVYLADSGSISLGERRLSIRRPADATAIGIGMVHQHYRLVERFSVSENLLLAAGGRAGLRDPAAAAALLLAMAEETGLQVDPDALVADLSVAERQRAEICKVLALGARFVILDEPTAVLTDREAHSLLQAVRRMAGAGRSVILITHKLREVVGHSDRVTIMRQGRTVATSLDTASLTQEQIARLMMGEHSRPRRVPSAIISDGPDLLVTSGLSVAPTLGGVALRDVDLRVRAGEILGIAGVGGNGQPQLVNALLGLEPVAAGSIQIDGAVATHAGIAERRALGLRIIPADRMASGLVASLSVADNLALTRVRSGFYRRLWLDRKRLRRDAEASIARHNILGATPAMRTALLSGGNAQKVLLARELDAETRLLVAHSPTRGLDVKACASVHGAIRALVAAGAACLLISEDLEEIMTLCDRIAVMSAGRITGELPGDASAEAIGSLMIGHV